MLTFAYYNYQFGKILQPRQGELFDTLPDPEESFRRNQDILDELIRADYEGERKITFVNARRTKAFRHCYMAPPQDGLTVLKIQNRHLRKTETRDFGEELREEFPACLVVIDNRPGIQRIVIEKKGAAFADITQVQGILQTTLRLLLQPYGLSISVDQLHTREAFWNVVANVKQYPLGFRRMMVRLPHLNLERISKVMKRYIDDARGSFGSSLALDFRAPDGGRLNLDEKDERQQAFIATLTEDVGGNNTIGLYPVGAGAKPVQIGSGNYRTAGIREDTFDKLGAADADERGRAMDALKRFTKKFIDD